MVHGDANLASSNSGATRTLSRLCEYCRFVYEEEKQRTVRLNEAVKTYLAFLALVVTFGLLKYLPVKELIADVSTAPGGAPKTTLTGIVGGCLAVLTVLSFGASLLCTILVLKVWHFERLCDPEETVARSVKFFQEEELLASMAADYAVSANRNHAINEKKAQLLSWALFLLISSLILFAGASLLLNLFPTHGRATP